MSISYSKKIMEHFLNPKNMGEIKNPDGIAEIGNPTCGDIMHLEIKVEKNKIKDIKFKTFGCAAAIASTSVISEIAKGKNLEEAKKITLKDMLKKLGKMPKIKTHCAQMSIQSLKKAIENYENKINRK
jgi:nitrogen fixation NifU-like protein